MKKSLRVTSLTSIISLSSGKLFTYLKATYSDGKVLAIMADVESISKIMMSVRNCLISNEMISDIFLAGVKVDPNNIKGVPVCVLDV